MNTIYAYSTKTYLEFRKIIKVGQTTQESAQIRVKQQDGTSNPEPLDILKVWKVPDYITDHKIHAWLRKNGFIEYREDAEREWYVCTVEDIDRAINALQHGIARANNFAMRDEQRACHDQIVNLFKNDASKHALMNAKMRFGKTFTTYQICKTLGYKRILVLTYKPSVNENWREDLEEHIDFDGWKYIDYKKYDSNNPVMIDDDGTPTVLFASFQDVNSLDKNKWKYLKYYHFDILVIDEMHYGSDTETAKKTLTNLKYDRILNVSGTPLDALMSGEFLDEEIYSWTYAEEQRKKKAERESGWPTQQYRMLPTMSFYTFEVAEDAKAMQNMYSKEEAFTMTKMLATDEFGNFIDLASVNKLIMQLFGEHPDIHKKLSPSKIINKCNHILFYLPPSVVSVTAFCKLLEQKYGHLWKIVNASGNNENDITEVKSIIGRYPQTITVSCGRFNTGVSVPEWDAVVMLDDGRSATTYWQTVFRCQTPDKKRIDKECYVLDFNPQRCLEMTYEYAYYTAKGSEGTEKTLREFLEFAPILEHSSNSIKQIDVNTVLNTISELGDHAAKFGSASMYDWNNMENVANIFENVKAEKSVKVNQEINNNGIELGKNFIPSRKTKERTETPEEIKEKKLLREKIITTMRRLPTYLFIEENKIENTTDIINLANDSLFSEAVGISLQDFKHLCDNFIKIERLDRCIMSYRQIEKQ